MSMPYEIKMFPVGQNARPTPHKIYPSGASCVATEEEAAVWAYVAELRTTIESLGERVAAQAELLAKKAEAGRQPAKAGAR